MANDILTGMGFHHIGLKAADFEKSMAFYQGLGMKCVAKWGPEGRTIAMLDIGDGGRLEIFGDGGDAYSVNGKWVHLAFKVDDVDAAYARALSLGAQSHMKPKEITMAAEPTPMLNKIAFVKGPDEELIEFFHQIH